MRREDSGEEESKADEQSDTWYPSRDNWEEYIQSIETVERDRNHKMWAYIHFKNGKRAKIGMDMVYKHCPIPMLKFYEDHLYFTHR